MDRTPTVTITLTTTTTMTTTTIATANNLRLMCSYGGHIITHPHTKSLYYAGGDTRIITIPSATTLTLSSLITHLSTMLHMANPFTVKYQLPSHDLDSLISLSNDDDLLMMLYEHRRLSPTPSRIRLFIFQSKPNSELSQFNELKHPKTETWFADVLKSAKIMQKGFGLEGNCESNYSNNSEVSGGGGAESMVLEINSSFGSTSSSVSLSNLSAKAVQVEDFGAGLVDNKAKLSVSESFPTSESSSMGVSSAVSHPQTRIHQGPIALALAPAVENKFCYQIKSESKGIDHCTGVEMHETVQVSKFPLSLQFDQPQVQFVHSAAPQYLPQNPTSMMPISSYYVMGSPVPQQQTYYQNNQPVPIYFVPVGHPNNVPMQSGLFGPATFASTRSLTHPNPCQNRAQVPCEVVVASSVPEASLRVYITSPMPSSLLDRPHDESHRQAGGLPQVNQQIQSICTSSTETTNCTNELDDDLDLIQIYKSQPPAPALPSQYPTMTKSHDSHAVRSFGATTYGQQEATNQNGTATISIR